MAWPLAHFIRLYWGSIEEQIKLFLHVWVNYLVFIVQYLFEMANWRLGVVSNIIFDIFGTFQFSTKFWGLEPLFIENHFRAYKKNANAVSNILFV